jgi:hypothetical protein
LLRAPANWSLDAVLTGAEASPLVATPIVCPNPERALITSAAPSSDVTYISPTSALITAPRLHAIVSSAAIGTGSSSMHSTKVAPALAAASVPNAGVKTSLKVGHPGGQQ